MRYRCRFMPAQNYCAVGRPLLTFSEMGMGSPDNRREADDSCQAPCVGRSVPNSSTVSDWFGGVAQKSGTSGILTTACVALLATRASELWRGKTMQQRLCPTRCGYLRT